MHFSEGITSPSAFYDTVSFSGFLRALLHPLILGDFSTKLYIFCPIIFFLHSFSFSREEREREPIQMWLYWFPLAVRLQKQILLSPRAPSYILFPSNIRIVDPAKPEIQVIGSFFEAG